ncbi:hypothetical protein [Streptomyces sp. CC228A]|nr:hypothetical protein [Streptomyces sp. CC228A]
MAEAAVEGGICQGEAQRRGSRVGAALGQAQQGEAGLRGRPSA